MLEETLIILQIVFIDIILAADNAIIIGLIAANFAPKNRKQITQTLRIPTIGIGSSKYCDGQVLVTDDLIGLNNTKIRFVKKFINIKKYIKLGLKKFRSEVKLKKYPSQKHSY